MAAKTMKLSDEIVHLAGSYGPVSPKGVEAQTDGRVSRQNAWNAIQRLVRDNILTECPAAPGAYMLTGPPPRRRS